MPPMTRAMLLAAALALPLITGCATLRSSGPPAPIPAAAPLVCPASLAADIEPEPLPPAGIDPSTLPPGLGAFLFGEWLPWARGNVQRLDQAKVWCEGRS